MKRALPIFQKEKEAEPISDELHRLSLILETPPMECLVHLQYVHSRASSWSENFFTPLQATHDSKCKPPGPGAPVVVLGVLL